jgi:tetratricopeptide (TPR) repeat protein
MKIIRHRTVALGLLAISACTGDRAAQASATTSAVTVPHFAYSTKSAEARQHAETGDRLEDTGYQIKANEEFKLAIAADSSFAYAYLRAAETAVTPDDYTTNLNRAMARMASASAVERLMIQADSASFQNDVQGALARVRKVTELEPKNARAWALLGNWLYNNGNNPSAREAYAKAIALDSSYALPMFLMGATYIFDESKDLAKAEGYVLAGQKFWPNEPVSYLWLGNLRRAQNRMDDAIAAYTRMIELDPKATNPHMARGNANTLAGHFDAAQKDFDDALRVAAPAEKVNVGMRRVWVDAYRGNFDSTLTGLSELEHAIDGLHVAAPDQDKAVLRYAQSIIAIFQRRFTVADTAIREFATNERSVAKAMSPSAVRWADGQVANLEGTLAAFRGDFATANARAADIERNRKADNGPDKDQQLHGLRGVTALLQKNYTLADTELRAADPTGGLMTFVYCRGLAMKGLGRTAEAKSLFQRVATHNFNNQENAAVHTSAIAELKALQ